MKKINTKKILKNLTKEDVERLELLQKAHERKGKQLRIDLSKGELAEFDEIREIINKDFESPEKKYDLYYKGIRRILIDYLPRGKDYQSGRQLIYDEKNVFLNLGKKKSDNNGIRKSDGRMTYQTKMKEMLDVIVDWISTSQNPSDLYFMLYDLNEKHGYGHEVYDQTSIKMQKAVQKIKGQKTPS